MMRSLDVSQCAGDVGKPSVNTRKMCVCGIGKRNIFEAVASCGAGDVRFPIIRAQTENEVLMSSMVRCVTDLGNKGCDDLRAWFWSEHFGGCFIGKCGHSL